MFRKFFAKRRSGKNRTQLSTSFNIHNAYQPRVYPSKALAVAEFFRGVQYLSTQIAKLKFTVKDSKNQVLEDNRTFRLFSQKPNPESTAFQLRSWLVSQAILNGNGYCEIVRDRLERPVALWPLGPYELCALRDENGNLLYRMAQPRDTSNPYLLPKDVFHLRNTYSEDGVMGISTLRFAARAIGISESSSDFALNVFKQGGIAAGYIKHKETLKKDVLERLQKGWENQDSLGRVKVLEEGMEFIPNQVTDSLQFLDTRKFSVLEIARFLGVSPSKLFHNEKYVASSVEEANIESAIDTLDTWCKNFEEEIDRKLLMNQPGVHAQFDLYDLYRGNMQSRAEYFKKMLEIGVLSPNEIREKEGLNPYPMGDKYFIPTNNLSPIDRMDEQIDAKIKSLNQPKPQPMQKEKEDMDSPKEIDNLVSTSEPLLRPWRAHLTGEGGFANET